MKQGKKVKEENRGYFKPDTVIETTVSEKVAKVKVSLPVPTSPNANVVYLP